MTHNSETPSLDTLLGKMNEPEVPNGLADKIIAAATKLPQDDASDGTIASVQLKSEPIAVRPLVAPQKNRKYITQPNISKWRKIKNSAFLSNNFSSRTAMYIGGMILVSSITIGSFLSQNHSEQINNAVVTNNTEDSLSSVAEANIPTPSIATETADTPPLNASNSGKIAAIINTNSNGSTDIVTITDQNSPNKLDRETAIATEQTIITPSIEKIDTTTIDDDQPSAGQFSSQSEIRTAQIPDSVKNDELDDIPVIVRKSDPLPKIDNITESDRIEPRFGITDTPLQNPKTLPEGDGDLPTPKTNIPAREPRLPFPDN